jgi:Domain of unknown function DUF29
MTVVGNAIWAYGRSMPDSLYERDVLAWSQHQADLLRRLGRGERVNDVDWENVAEEIEGVGLSELHSVESFLNLVMVHLLKIQASPDDTVVDHWHSEITAFQGNARRRFTQSMRQRIDLDALYADALHQMRAGDRRSRIPRSWPDANPFTLDQLLNADTDDLMQRLLAATQSTAGQTP